jgi:stage III sporulation protein AD
VIDLDIIQIVGFALAAAILALIVKEFKPVFAFFIVAFAGIILFLTVIGKIGLIINVINDLANRSGIPDIYLKTILKIIGISYIAEFGAQMVRDAGQEGLASKIEFAGKVLILVLAIPIINIVVETLLSLVPGTIGG